MSTILEHLQSEIHRAVGLSNYRRMVIIENADLFPEEAKQAQAELLRKGIAVDQVDRDRIAVVNKRVNNILDERFTIKDIAFICSTISTLDPETMALEINKLPRSISVVVNAIRNCAIHE